MSSPPQDHSSVSSPRVTLEVPTVPASRFVLPPPSSDLLSRVQAFLPQMKAANDQLDSTMQTDEQDDQDEGEDQEAVTLEILSSDSSDDDSSGDSDSSESDKDASDNMQPAGQAQDDSVRDGEGRAMSHLLNIAQRPKVIRKSLVQDVDSEKPSSSS
ncbi:hypothetical protein ACM66B_002997 [Microbotryomycetes sp. NB124-2]